MSVVVMVLLQDGLEFSADDPPAEAAYRLLIYCCVPEDWLTGPIPDSEELWLKGPTLTDARAETIFQALYGPDWRLGNGDGSRYVILGIGSRLLNPRRASERPWLADDPNNAALRFFHFVADENGALQRVAPSDL